MVHTAYSDRVAAEPGDAATQARQESARPVGAFDADVLAKMGHHLRSPVAGIAGLVRVMLLKARAGQLDPAKLVEQLEMIQDNAHRSMTTVERVLEAAKVALAATATEVQPLDLGNLLTEVADTPHPAVERHASTLRADVPRQPVVVRTDPDILSRLLRELIDNALTVAGATQVRLGLGAGAGPGQIVIEVSDDGAGIPDKDHARIFDAFERGTGAAQLAPNGIGMGLYLARKMADRLGAELSMSSSPDAGSTFTLTFGPLSTDR